MRWGEVSLPQRMDVRIAGGAGVDGAILDVEFESEELEDSLFADSGRLKLCLPLSIVIQLGSK